MSVRPGRMRPQQQPPGAGPARPGGPRVLPFDHGASFRLAGRPGAVVQDVINIGADAVFVATAISYGFEEERGRELRLRPPRGPAAGSHWVPGDVTLGQFPVDALMDGVRLAPRFERIALTSDDAATPELLEEPLAPQQLDAAFERVRHVGGGASSSDDLSFLFTLTDSASGRELQDAPAHNLASLGGADGQRPFRPLAQPVTFLPRSTVRVQVEERSFDRRGTLFVVLHGYKVLGGSACPEPVPGALAVRFVPPPAGSAIPFDYVASVPLTGRPGNRLETEIPISADGDFVATSIGYGLAPEDRLEIDFAAVDRIVDPGLAKRIRDHTNTLNNAGPARPGDRRFALGNLPLRAFGALALREGFRLRPEYVRLALDGSGRLATVTVDQILRMFESLNRPEDVSFRYAISDTGSGTDLQNEPLHNVAGLGIANGDRPFKRLALPMHLLPRSTLRITVLERFGRGRLFFAFHGFKRMERA